jgi:CMP-N,N'-diacetyllegionaminic acid synthase
MKVLIIGYGSIGKRHYEVLTSLKNIKQVDLVTSQIIENDTTFKKIKDVKNLNDYDYFVIASETIKHYEQLKYICSKVENKNILVEKPLYNKKNKKIKTNNNIFTAYNLRFHPILQKIKKLIKDETVYYANIMCGQYLPTWRPNQDYTKSYSADINKGGGVLRDLSHELDYTSWLFGGFDNIKYLNTKISDLKINSDDIFTLIGTTKNKTIINLSIDYISKITTRRLIIHTKNKTIEADMINNTIFIKNKKDECKTIKLESIDRNYTYKKMHQSILKNKYKKVCSFTEGEKIVNNIQNIKYKEL